MAAGFALGVTVLASGPLHAQTGIEPAPDSYERLFGDGSDGTGTPSQGIEAPRTQVPDYLNREPPDSTLDYLFRPPFLSGTRSGDDGAFGTGGAAPESQDPYAYDPYAPARPDLGPVMPDLTTPTPDFAPPQPDLTTPQPDLTPQMPGVGDIPGVPDGSN